MKSAAGLAAGLGKAAGSSDQRGAANSISFGPRCPKSFKKLARSEVPSARRRNAAARSLPAGGLAPAANAVSAACAPASPSFGVNIAARVVQERSAKIVHFKLSRANPTKVFSVHSCSSVTRLSPDFADQSSASAARAAARNGGAISAVYRSAKVADSRRAIEAIRASRHSAAGRCHRPGDLNTGCGFSASFGSAL